MGKERYELEIAPDKMIFEFTSVGPKGKIPKLVIYSKLPNRNVYNLGFGDKDLETGKIDDLVVTDNKDSQKVLATVASTLYVFLNQYPNTFVTATGSTRARTRLYQMGISNNLEDIMVDFIVLGRKDGVWDIFEKNIAYDAFLITNKKI